MKSTALNLFAIFLLGAITYCYRFSFINSRGRKIAEKIPQEFLRLLAPATFTALIANHLVGAHGSNGEAPLKLLVAGLSLVVAYFTRSIIGTLMFGLGLLYFLQNWKV